MGCVLGSIPGGTDKCVRLGAKESDKICKPYKIARICALYKAYSTEPTWETIGDRLQRPYYLSQVEHDWKIRNRRKRMDIGKYSIVNRTIQFCKKLPMNALGTFPSKPSTFRKRVRKVVSELKWGEGNMKYIGNRVFPSTWVGKWKEKWSEFEVRWRSVIQAWAKVGLQLFIWKKTCRLWLLQLKRMSHWQSARRYNLVSAQTAGLHYLHILVVCLLHLSTHFGTEIFTVISF